MNGRTRIFSRWFPGALLVAGAIVGVVVPLATSANGPSPSPSPIPQGCQLRSPQPEAPLQLNVVGLRNLAKTIAVEKEVFNCFDAQSNLTRVKDVSTVIEFTERAKKGSSFGKHPNKEKGSSPGFVTVGKSVEADTCTKDLQTGSVSCSAAFVPLQATNTPLAGCKLTSGTYPFEPVQQPTHPVELGTATLANGLVKTVQVEKEVFDCNGRIGDVYLFTEMVEAARSDSFQKFGTQFDGVVCFKDEATAQIAGCKLFTPRTSA